MAILTSFALWLHDLATVILIGHYLLLRLVYLPLLTSEFQAAEMSQLLSKVNHRLAAYNPHPPILYRMSAMIKIQAALGVLVLFLTGLARMG